MAKKPIQQNPQQTNKPRNKLKLDINDLITLNPATDNQEYFFNLYDSNISAMILHGVAGTGKTFISVYKALEEVLDPSYIIDQLVIVRSAVASRDIGFLPGSEKEKADVFAAPYVDICSRLFNRGDAFQRLQEQKFINFMTTSFIRGITLDNSIIIVDEFQNLNFQELSSIITRVGLNSKIIFCGDIRQTDLNKKSDQSGLKQFIEITKIMSSFRGIEFNVDDIVRSDLVKEFIVAQLQLEG